MQPNMLAQRIELRCLRRLKLDASPVVCVGDARACSWHRIASCHVLHFHSHSHSGAMAHALAAHGVPHHGPLTAVHAVHLAHALDPQMEGAARHIKALTQTVEGRDI